MAEKDDKGKNVFIAVLQQEKILCEKKKYITDFLFQIHTKVYSADFCSIHPPIPIIQLCVEFDGHDFYERTKEQARHDKERDRAV